jgi:SAM-dependent MidA family methyltransferase
MLNFLATLSVPQRQSMTPLHSELVSLIRREGPISFERYMDLCLYHPEFGYYTFHAGKSAERFGRDGDYYTSAQLGTVFAQIMMRRFAAMRQEIGGDFTILEVGPGRGDFGRVIAREFPYIPVEYGDPWPESPIRGCIFSNEFFDALPVRAYHDDAEALVTERDGALGWVGDPPNREFSPRAAGWIERFAQTLECGYVVAVDYGYRGRERERFPVGSLMTYRAHQASEDVFADPGERDITAHVDFDLLADAGRAAGLEETAFDPQSRYLMGIGEADEFACLFDACKTETDRVKSTLMLKNLLFGIGETMRVIEMRKRT